MKLTDQTLNQVALNPDGKTYNGLKAMQWIFEAVTGSPMSDEEVRRLAAEAQERARIKRAQAGLG